jgi:hypothetical protein
MEHARLSALIKIAEAEIAEARNAERVGDPQAPETLQKWSDLLEGLRVIQQQQESK